MGNPITYLAYSISAVCIIGTGYYAIKSVKAERDLRNSVTSRLQEEMNHDISFLFQIPISIESNSDESTVLDNVYEYLTEMREKYSGNSLDLLWEHIPKGKHRIELMDKKKTIEARIRDLEQIYGKQF